MEETLPLLPGYRFHDVTKTNFAVPQTLTFKNGHRIVRIRKDDIHLNEEEQQLLNDFQPELIYGKVQVEPAKTFIPPCLHYDKKILRFYGYFKESFHGNLDECYRIRRVTIHYYLEDDTISIYENPYDNSSLVQGRRLHRHRLVKNDQNEFYTWKDLNLGQHISIYGINYRICDCDAFTREWLESEGIEVQCPESIPMDPYVERLISKVDKEQHRTGPSDLKEILPDRWRAETNIVNKQFFRSDGRILRFNAILDDHHSTENDHRKFLIHFYPVDQTIDIRVIRHANDGYDPTSSYLHRQKVPKDSVYTINSFVNLFISKSEQEKIDYLNIEDFLHGGHITIFHRRFFLYDCDDCTKNYLKEKFGRCPPYPLMMKTDAQRDCQISIHLPPIPPHGMFGKPEDTIQNVKSLIPKPMRKDRMKLDENENRVLRYRATMISPEENDQQREFIIIYRLADDLISVYEKPSDGYGRSTRKFLERLRIPKPNSDPSAPMYYEPNDFYIGACVEFFAHRFRIIDADRCVLKFIEENSSRFSPHVIQSFRNETKLCKD